MSDVWYYADTETSVGPLTIVELKKTLRMLPNPNDVLVWCADFTEWKKAGEIAELRTRTPPPVPSSTNNDRTPTRASKMVVVPGGVMFLWLNWKPIRTRGDGLDILRTR